MRKKVIILSVIVLTILLLTAWIIWGNLSIKVTEYTVTSQNLPQTFDYFRIVQISDLHNTNFGKNNQRLLDIIRNAEPDIIVLTGDLIDFYNPKPDISLSFIEKAVQIAPCYYVTGNHETRLKNEYPNFRSEIIRMGVYVLEDDSILYEKNGESIRIAGLSDYASVSADYVNSILDDSTYNLLLSHRPDHIEAYKESTADLVLCGHTHGGQLRLPILGAVFAPGQGLFPQFDVGMYQLENTTMIISQGLGNSSIPFRVNCRPEVVIIELSCN